MIPAKLSAIALVATLWGSSLYTTGITEKSLMQSAQALFSSRKVLALDSHSLELFIEKIRFIAYKHVLDEKVILHQLLDYTATERDYRNAHREKNYDPRTFHRRLFIASAVTLASMAIPLYCYYTCKCLAAEKSELEKDFNLSTANKIERNRFGDIMRQTTYTYDTKGLDPNGIVNKYKDLVDMDVRYAGFGALTAFLSCICSLASAAIYTNPELTNPSDFYPHDESWYYFATNPQTGQRIFRQKPQHDRWYAKLSDIEKLIQQALSAPRKNLVFEYDDVLIAPSKERYWEAEP